MHRLLVGIYFGSFLFSLDKKGISIHLRYRCIFSQCASTCCVSSTFTIFPSLFAFFLNGSFY